MKKELMVLAATIVALLTSCGYHTNNTASEDATTEATQTEAELESELEETITYKGKTYTTEELTYQTLHWLQLSEEERAISSYYPPEFIEFENPWEITLSVEDVTPTSANIVCTQSGGEVIGELITGSYYIIESWSKEYGWTEVPYAKGDIEVCWKSIGLIIPNNDTCQWEVDWEWLYGELPSGKYRIGKEIFGDTKDQENKQILCFAQFQIY